MALQMKSECERCRARLELAATALICSYECTFCSSCSDELGATCPNCGGELQVRPKRGAATSAEVTTSPRTHRYSAICSWLGETGRGYENYQRAHRVVVPPSGATLELSSDPAFRGDPKLLNPEQMLVAAAASCQLLSFLALAARASLDVRRYEDHADGEMPENERPIRIARIRLRPRIELVRGPSEERVRDLVGRAHEECYIASSLKTEVSVEPVVVFI